jgi:hypothetical protein
VLRTDATHEEFFLSHFFRLALRTLSLLMR